jgi:hypothetical protein
MSLVEPEDDSDISPVEPEDGTSRVITVSTTFIVEMGVPTLEIVDTPSLVIDDVDKSAEDATEDVEEPSLIKVEALSTSTDGGLLSIEEEVSIRELGNTGGGGGLVNDLNTVTTITKTSSINDASSSSLIRGPSSSVAAETFTRPPPPPVFPSSHLAMLI